MIWALNWAWQTQMTFSILIWVTNLQSALSIRTDTARVSPHSFERYDEHCILLLTWQQGKGKGQTESGVEILSLPLLGVLWDK